MMQPAEDGSQADPIVGGHRPPTLKLRRASRWTSRDSRSKRHMWVASIVEDDKLNEDRFQVTLVDRNQVIETFSTKVPTSRSHSPLHCGIRTGGLSTRRPNPFSARSTSAEKIASRSWIKKR